jgi:hypothetical protein
MSVKVRTWRPSDPLLHLHSNELDKLRRNKKSTLAICEIVESVLGIPPSYQYLQSPHSVSFLNGADGNDHASIDKDMIDSLLKSKYINIFPNRDNGAVRSTIGKSNSLPEAKKLRQLHGHRREKIIGWDITTGKHPENWIVEYRIAGRNDMPWEQATVTPNKNFFSGSVMHQYRYNTPRKRLLYF